VRPEILKAVIVRLEIHGTGRSRPNQGRELLHTNKFGGTGYLSWPRGHSIAIFDVCESPSKIHSLKIEVDQGDSKAQFNYAICLMKGDGISIDLPMAARYLKLAADQGYAEA
jgi:TPR repeat protein